MTQLDRIEQKIDAIGQLLMALIEEQPADDQDDEPEFDLSGLVSARPRDDMQPL